MPKNVIRHWLEKRSLGLKGKITLLIVLNVAGVIWVTSYLDYRLSTKDQIDLLTNRNLNLARQIDLAVPDPRIEGNLPRITDELEEWLLSRQFLRQIDLFLFRRTGWKQVVSVFSEAESLDLTLSQEQLSYLRQDKFLSLVRDSGKEKFLEVITPLHAGKRVIGGVRIISNLDEIRVYLNKKRNRMLILTFSAIFILLITLTVSFRRVVGKPIEKLISAMSSAEMGNLSSEVDISSRDELGALAMHFNRMLCRIRKSHEENVALLARVNQFNEELSRKVEEATVELAKRNEELRVLNEALFESQRNLSRSEKLAALGEVAAAMAHQIGTPLNSISGYIQLMLQENRLHPIDRNRLEIIESQLERLADSVKNLLSITRQPKPSLKPLELNGIIEELVRLSEPWLNTRKVQLSLSLFPGLPPVLGDLTQLQTLILNLITNAIDAMPGGGILTIKTDLISGGSPEDGHWVEVSFADTGVGITEEAKKKIFDPFFTTKKSGEGTGLGLTICDKIVKEHRGRLKFESEVGKGSLFTVQIPVAERKNCDEQDVHPSAGYRR